MYGENGLMGTNWWWVSLPKATGAIHSTRGVVDITPPYFKFVMGKSTEQMINMLHRGNYCKIIRMEDDDKKEERVRYS
jgi:hypothetical protein